MVRKKRWGRRKKDGRDWKVYNAKLVKRGEFYINPYFLETWLDETKEMNSGKVGQPYMYPDSMIKFLAILKAKNFDYRSLQGAISALSQRLGNFPIICYSQIRRRINQLEFKFSPKEENMIVAVDGTGMKVSNRGEWIRQKWAVRRGWIKIIIMGDTKGNIVDIRLGNENLDENASGRGMLRKNHKKIDKYMGDGLHDTKNNFKLLDQLGITPVIKIRKNASTKAKGCMARKKQVIKYKNQGYKKWAKTNNYGLRWPASEGIFAAIKTIFGEHVNSHKKPNMYHEAKLKFWAYQQLKNI